MTGATRSSARPVLAVERLRTEFSTKAGLAVAVDDVSFELREAETLAIVGESGSGKSVTALSILGLLPPVTARVAGGTVRFGGRDLLSLDRSQLQDVRGAQIAMIFQDPMTSLNPVLTIGRQLTEAVYGTSISIPARRPRVRSRCSRGCRSLSLRGRSGGTLTSCRAACASAS